MRIKKIGIISFAKFQTVQGALIGFLCGIIYSFGGLLIDILVTLNLVHTSETPGLSYGTLLAFGALIGMPIIFSVTGFFLGITGAVLFNFTSKWFGGIQIEASE